MKHTLNALFEGKILNRNEAKEVAAKIADGQYSESEIASFLTVYRMRNITAEELAGFRDAFLDVCVSIDLGDMKTIDVCGTGGDEKNTFNISTLTAFVLAGAGIKVVKHGNYSVSSSCGSSNIFEQSGYKLSNDILKIKNEIEKANICYLHAPLFHPAMRHVGPVRKALKIKTFFNILGPLVNPAKPKYQLAGVYNEEVMQLYSDVFKLDGVNHSIVFALDGYDEISLTSDFRIMTNNSDKTLSPADLGLNKQKAEDLFGGETIDEALKIFTNILEGKGTEAQNQAVIANTAVGIQTYYPEKEISECVSLAKDSLLNGKALNAYTTLINIQ